MEEEKKEEEKINQPQPERVFFDQPAVLRNDNGNKKVIIPIILLIVLLLSVGGWFLFKGRQQEFSASPTPTATPSIIEEIPTPAPTVDKQTIDIEILNGTGISGEAAFLQDALKKLGYTSIKTGNAQNQDYTKTQVSFLSSVSSEVKTEIETELKKLYKEVEVGGALTGNQLEVRVITGFRKGSTPKPTATATPKPSPSPTPSPTKTASPTPSPTPTPAP